MKVCYVRAKGYFFVVVIRCASCVRCVTPTASRGAPRRRESVPFESDARAVVPVAEDGGGRGACALAAAPRAGRGRARRARRVPPRQPFGVAAPAHGPYRSRQGSESSRSPK